MLLDMILVIPTLQLLLKTRRLHFSETSGYVCMLWLVTVIISHLSQEHLRLMFRFI